MLLEGASGSARDEQEEIVTGALVTEDGAHRYPIVGGIPRFVAAENYADNFGLQWNHFRRTQLDSHSGHPISRDRFYRYTGWQSEMLAGKRVLDVGCGAGRFAEIALDAGATVVALDYSSAVDACRANHQGNERLEVVQGDIYALPFAPGSFDFVYCLGVLQHTPDVRRAFLSLPPMLATGGRLAVDLYPRIWLNLLWCKYWLRPITTRIEPRRLFGLIQTAVRALLPVSVALGRVPRLGRRLRYAIPVMQYDGIFPLTPTQQYEWAVLDTYDMFSPQHDHPQNAPTLRAWFAEAGLDEVWVGRLGFLVGRGRRSP